MNGYIVNSYKLARRILEVEPNSIVVVVETLFQSKSYVTKKRIKMSLDKCTSVRMLYPFSLVNEEIINNLIKEFGLTRIRVTNSLLRTMKDKSDYSSLTDSQLQSILNSN